MRVYALGDLIEKVKKISAGLRSGFDRPERSLSHITYPSPGILVELRKLAECV
jgi:hypothetical protein